MRATTLAVPLLSFAALGCVTSPHSQPLTPAVPSPVRAPAAETTPPPFQNATIDSKGACQTTLASTADADALKNWADTCGKLLFPIAGQATTPGLLFIGAAFGSKSNKFAIAPSVAVNAGAAIPLVRPSLGYYMEPPDGAAAGAADVVKFRPPVTGQFYLNLIASGNVAVSGFLYPGTTGAGGAGTATDFAWSVGGYGGLEFGTVTYATGGAVKGQLAGTVGLIVGYLGGANTVGDALIIGVQPGFVVRF